MERKNHRLRLRAKSKEDERETSVKQKAVEEVQVQPEVKGNIKHFASDEVGFLDNVSGRLCGVS